MTSGGTEKPLSKYHRDRIREIEELGARLDDPELSERKREEISDEIEWRERVLRPEAESTSHSNDPQTPWWRRDAHGPNLALAWMLTLMAMGMLTGVLLRGYTDGTWLRYATVWAAIMGPIAIGMLGGFWLASRGGRLNRFDAGDPLRREREEYHRWRQKQNQRESER